MRSLTASLAIAIAACVLSVVPDAGQVKSPPKRYALEAATGLKLQRVNVEPATLDGKKGVRVSAAAAETQEEDDLAIIDEIDFANGTIEAEIAGQPAPGAGEGARGFVGIAFRVRTEGAFDGFYLRPTNGRADDQERRNHAVQYISHPEWPWSRLRKETPGRYESYVDLVAGEWTKIKIDVRGDKARLYVHGAEQPTLIVNDVKSGGSATGKVALWVGSETVAHFRDLTVTRRD